MLHILPPHEPPVDGEGGAIADRSTSLFVSAGGFEATVLCAVGEQVGETIFLAYLSLLGPGTTVVALWATLMDHHNTRATLEDDGGVIGQLQLWQRRPDLADLGYRLSWRRRHIVLPRAHGARLVHLVTEPDLLTCRDPEQVESGRQRSGKGRDKGMRGGKDGKDGKDGDESGAAREAAAIASRPSNGRRGPSAPSDAPPDATAGGSLEIAEQVARETRPLFLLLRMRDEDAHALACRHLLFLAERIQWLAYYEPWADALWARARQTGEAVLLTIWPSVPEPMSEPVSERRQGEQTDEQILDLVGHDHRPWIRDAWLCRPQPLTLAAALRSLIAGVRDEQPTNEEMEKEVAP